MYLASRHSVCCLLFRTRVSGWELSQKRISEISALSDSLPVITFYTSWDPNFQDSTCSSRYNTSMEPPGKKRNPEERQNVLRQPCAAPAHTSPFSAQIKCSRMILLPSTECSRLSSTVDQMFENEFYSPIEYSTMSTRRSVSDSNEVSYIHIRFQFGASMDAFV